jgi:hypothetical protein
MTIPSALQLNQRKPAAPANVMKRTERTYALVTRMASVTITHDGKSLIETAGINNLRSSGYSRVGAAIRPKVTCITNEQGLTPTFFSVLAL